MKLKFLLSYVLVLALIFSCSEDSDNEPMDNDTAVIDPTDDDNNSSEIYADIDFSNWKVTLPVDEDNNGSPDEYQPSQLINGGYRNDWTIRQYMYDDTTDTSIEFYTSPGISTTNSSYSRTELRELINPSNSRDNWTLAEGGEMIGSLRLVEITEDNQNSNRDFHRTIVMQIHGIISQEDMNIHGFSSNNGPPLIKIYWEDGHIWSFKKSLVNEATTGDALLSTSSDTWEDEKIDMGFVGYEKFDFRITASDARLELQLNDSAPLVYEDISLNKWPFENYFKAGNYLNTTAAGAFSKVKYYSLTVTH
ncbi:MAG: polysaccharide lyase family 7 protein [Bacteroidota bacterium]